MKFEIDLGTDRRAEPFYPTWSKNNLGKSEDGAIHSVGFYGADIEEIVYMMSEYVAR